MLLAEHQRRIDTIAAAERILQRREQQVAVREEVLREALRAGGGGGSGAASQWEREIDRMVTESAARLPPPIAISAFVHALEDRAVELEVMYTALERRAQQLEEERRALQQRQAQLAHKETYLTQWMQSMEVSLRAMCEQEDALASQARRRQEGEAELLAWTQELRDKEDTLETKERVVIAKLKETTARERRLQEEASAAEALRKAQEMEAAAKASAESEAAKAGNSNTTDIGNKEMTPLEAALAMEGSKQWSNAGPTERMANDGRRSADQKRWGTVSETGDGWGRHEYKDSRHNGYTPHDFSPTDSLPRVRGTPITFGAAGLSTGTPSLTTPTFPNNYPNDEVEDTYTHPYPTASPRSPSMGGTGEDGFYTHPPPSRMTSGYENDRPQTLYHAMPFGMNGSNPHSSRIPYSSSSFASSNYPLSPHPLQ